MALDPVLPISNGSASSPITVTAAQFRRLDVASTMVHDHHDLAARPGVCSGLATTVSGLTVTVSTGSAIVTPALTTNGSYRVAAGSPTSVTLAARNATFSRRDLIVLRVLDGSVDTSGQWQASLVAITGVPAAAPADPATQTGDLILARAVVPPTGTVTVVDLRTYTAALGGVITCVSTDRPSGSSLRPGQHIYERDTGLSRVWDGSAWVTDIVGATTTNPTGGYTKLPDGTMICWVSTTASVALPSAYGSGLFIGTWVWNFPQVFLAAPAVSVGQFLWGPSGSWGSVSAVTASTATLRGHDILQRAAGSTLITATAVGRWR